MSSNEKVLMNFSARIQQLILQYKDAKKENAELYATVAELEQKVEKLENKLTQAQNDFDSLKMAKMLHVTDEDVEGTQKKIAKLVRDVNKCITLLSEK